MHTQTLSVVKMVPAAAYRPEATVTITLLSSECDGRTMVDVKHGNLNRDEVVVKALAALAQEIVEMILPFPL